MSDTVTNYGGRLNFKIHPGATFRFRLTYRPGGEAADLTGCTLYLWAKATAGTEVYYLTSGPGGGIVIDPDQVGEGKGRATVTLPAGLTPPTGTVTIRQTLSILLADGSTRTLGSGSVEFADMPRAGAKS